MNRIGGGGVPGPAGPPGAAGVPGTPGQTVGNSLMDGGGVVHLTDLSVRVSAASYTINGTSYTSPQADLTFSAADGSNPRIDVIAVNSSGAAVIVAGTAAANPFEPVLDPGTQLRLTAVTIGTGATTLTTANTIIFTEGGGESWTETASGAPVNVASATSPITGSINVQVTAGVAGNYANFANGSDFDTTTRNVLSLTIKNDAAWSNQRSLLVQWYDSTVARGTAVTIRNGQYGFSGSDLTTEQQIAIPMQAFGVAGLPVDTLRITLAGTGGTFTFKIDDIFMQAGVGQVQPTNAMVYRGTYSSAVQYVLNDVISYGGVIYLAGGDARAVTPPTSPWIRLPPPSTQTLTDAATINWNMATSYSAKVTLGDNRTMAAPTNLTDGGTYVLRVIQDGTGSRTITWNAVFKWPSATAPTLTTTAAGIDILTFVSDGTNLYGVWQGAFG